MTSILTNPRERTRFFRFLVVGIIGAFVDFGIANVLIIIFSFPLKIAGTISFICAIVSNFIFNRYWTYPDSRSKPIINQLFQFSLVNVTGLIIRIPILIFVEPIISNLLHKIPVEFINISPELLAKNITLAIAVFIVLFWNFFVNRYWTYSDVK